MKFCNKLNRLTSSIALALVAFSAQAGEWQVGSGVASGNSVIDGADSEVGAAPIINYQGERFSMLSGTLVYSLLKSDSYQFNLLGQAREASYETRDSDVLAGMESRESGFDIGVGIATGGLWGVVELEMLGDITGNYEGAEVSLSYSHPWQFDRWVIEPSFGLSWQSDELVDYYYGVKPSEATATRVAYRGKSTVNPYAEIALSYKLTRQWQLLAGVDAEWLGDGITNSPIVDKDYQVDALAALLYTF